MQRTNDNQPGGRDTNPHSGVQAWSKGDIFPAVICRVEYHYPLGYWTCWVLQRPGCLDLACRSYDEAYETAVKWKRAESIKAGYRAAHPRIAAVLEKLSPLPKITPVGKSWWCSSAKAWVPVLLEQNQQASDTLTRYALDCKIVDARNAAELARAREMDAKRHFVGAANAVSKARKSRDVARDAWAQRSREKVAACQVLADLERQRDALPAGFDIG